jgi:hypothetical protein
MTTTLQVVYCERLFSVRVEILQLLGHPVPSVRVLHEISVSRMNQVDDVLIGHPALGLSDRGDIDPA